MIVGVPDYNRLHETAVGWLNLAWEITIEEVQEFQDAPGEFEASSDGEHVVTDETARKYWSSAQYKLTNAISLLQQSLELFLKAKIAEVSPYLLIAGDPQSWPSPSSTGAIEFSDFRTLDAVQLCRAVKIVSADPLPDQFVEFYNRLRKARNKIMHLNSGHIQAEAKSILIDILQAHKYFFPKQLWVEFRKAYLIMAGEQFESEYFLKEKEEDYLHERLANELEAAFGELDAEHVKKFFQYDIRKPGFRCPRCLELRTSDAGWTFAQEWSDGSIKCVACLSVYTKEEYKSGIRRYFNYLDVAEQHEIDVELQRDFP